MKTKLDRGRPVKPGEISDADLTSFAVLYDMLAQYQIPWSIAFDKGRVTIKVDWPGSLDLPNGVHVVSEEPSLEQAVQQLGVKMVDAALDGAPHA